MKTYTTISGDTWDIIAWKTLGSEMYVHQLIDANLSYSQQYIFNAGVSLSIPLLIKSATVNLPPWRRNGR
jgi:phage tail protein X